MGLPCSLQVVLQVLDLAGVESGTSQWAILLLVFMAFKWKTIPEANQELLSQRCKWIRSSSNKENWLPPLTAGLLSWEASISYSLEGGKQGFPSFLEGKLSQY